MRPESDTTIQTLRLSPSMRKVLQGMTRAGRPPLHTLAPRLARAAYAVGSGVLEINRPELDRVQELSIPARDGVALHARLYATQSNAALPCMLYLHGGGFTVGSVETHDTLCREICRQSGCAVVSLDYRLAPEHRFPIAANDAWDAFTWLLTQASSLGLTALQIALGGDSAGGTLAASTAIEAALRGIPVALQLLFYPGVTAYQDTTSHQRYGSGLVLEAEAIQWFFGHYAPDANSRQDWRFAPLLAPEVDGLAPLWLGLAEFDPLVDEGIAYADKLRAQGVPVELEIYRGVTHEFIKMGRAVPEALDAHRDAASALRKALFKTETS
jgi:acetyl esterase